MTISDSTVAIIGTGNIGSRLAANFAAGDLVAGLIRAGGYEPVHVDGLDQSIRIEMYGDRPSGLTSGAVATAPCGGVGEICGEAS